MVGTLTQSAILYLTFYALKYPFNSIKSPWTTLYTEREEDLTGPYAYLAAKWIAFDDDTSLKIKVTFYNELQKTYILLNIY